MTGANNTPRPTPRERSVEVDKTLVVTKGSGTAAPIVGVAVTFLERAPANSEDIFKQQRVPKECHLGAGGLKRVAP